MTDLVKSDNNQEVLDPTLFIVDREATNDSWLELNSVEQIQLEDGTTKPRYNFVAKWNGCCHLYINYEIPEDNDYLHTDELDDLINHLIELRDRAKKHYASLEDWIP